MWQCVRWCIWQLVNTVVCPGQYYAYTSISPTQHKRVRHPSNLYDYFVPTICCHSVRPLTSISQLIYSGELHVQAMGVRSGSSSRFFDFSLSLSQSLLSLTHAHTHTNVSTFTRNPSPPHVYVAVIFDVDGSRLGGREHRQWLYLIDFSNILFLLLSQRLRNSGIGIVWLLTLLKVRYFQWMWWLNTSTTFNTIQSVPISMFRLTADWYVLASVSVTIWNIEYIYYLYTICRRTVGMLYFYPPV